MVASSRYNMSALVTKGGEEKVVLYQRVKSDNDSDIDGHGQRLNHEFYQRKTSFGANNGNIVFQTRVYYNQLVSRWTST